MYTQFSAAPQALGYLYQVRYALHLILDSREEAELSMESLDDVVFEKDGTPSELLQLKHHSKKAQLTDYSGDLWKTIRVWSASVHEGRVPLPDTLLTLVTTATAPEDSIAALLRPGDNRNTDLAYQRLLKVARTSGNKDLARAFDAFLTLTPLQQEMLIQSIQILDRSPDIHDTAAEIRKRIELAVCREHLEGLYERLEGWWFGKAVTHLGGHHTAPIVRFEVHTKIRDIADQFRPDALPIDFFDAVPPTPPDPEGDNRLFVMQLRAVALKNQRIEKAILDYYRAFEQRSRWVREELLIGDELEKYEKKLVDEWERQFLAVENEFLDDEIEEQELQQVGRRVYNWMELKADIRIRPQVTEEYVMRGSYHMLTDQDPPRVWWHPKFIERLEELLAIP